MGNVKVFLLINVFFIVVNLLILQHRLNKPIKVEPSPPKHPNSAQISEYLFGYQSYEEIITTLKDWESRSPDLLEVGTYGNSSKNKDQYYLKISNEYDPGKKKVLITACIHGNELLSASTVMAYVGKLISSYGVDPELTELVNKATIYVIPVVSPDSYAVGRGVDGVDPNRDFPTLKNPDHISVKPVQNLRDFFLEIKPDGVLSSHTYGRIFLIPWGDSVKNNPNHEDYKRIASAMADLSDYDFQKASEMYDKPIYGAEIDWYHRNGAFAMVMELGTHQRKPSVKETTIEFNRTFNSFVHFIRESICVTVK
jgi:hypothetical protein